MSHVSNPGEFAAVVVPSDATVLATPTRAIWVGVTGNIAVRMRGQNLVTFSNVPVGMLPVQVDKILSTGTTATTMLAIW
jgi:hypothetical protein